MFYVLVVLSYTNGYDNNLYPFPDTPIRGNIFLFPGILFLGNFLPLLRVSSFGIELSIQYNIERGALTILKWLVKLVKKPSHWEGYEGSDCYGDPQEQEECH